jgi:hypothetical protein
MAADSTQGMSTSSPRRNFLAEYFALSPLRRPTSGNTRTRPMAGPDRDGRLARIAFADRWEAETARSSSGPTPDDSVDRDSSSTGSPR